MELLLMDLLKYVVRGEKFGKKVTVNLTYLLRIMIRSSNGDWLYVVGICLYPDFTPRKKLRKLKIFLANE